jgi:hypothetical protein
LTSTATPAKPAIATGTAMGKPAAPTPAAKPARAAAAGAPASKVDMILAIAAAVVGIAAVVWVLFTALGPFALT